MKTKTTAYVFSGMVIVLLFASTATAQHIPRGFVLPGEIGQGFRSVRSLDHEVYLASLKTHPGYSFIDNKLRVGLSFASVYTSRTITLFTGPRITYKVYAKESDLVGEIFNIQLTSGMMWGTRGKQLYCFGIIVEPDPLFISFNGYSEESEEEFWFEVTAGINLDVMFSSDDE